MTSSTNPKFIFVIKFPVSLKSLLSKYLLFFIKLFNFIGALKEPVIAENKQFPSNCSIDTVLIISALGLYSSFSSWKPIIVVFNWSAYAVVYVPEK